MAICSLICIMEGDQTILFHRFVVLLLSRGTNEIRLTVSNAPANIILILYYNYII